MNCCQNRGGCEHCCKLMKTKRITHEHGERNERGERCERDEGIIVLHIDGHDICNREPECICVTKCLPDGTNGCEAVVVQVGCERENRFHMQNEFGEFIYSNKIKPRTVYHCTVATDSRVFCVHDRFVQRDDCHVYPRIHADCCECHERGFNGHIRMDDDEVAV